MFRKRISKYKKKKMVDVSHLFDGIRKIEKYCGSICFVHKKQENAEKHQHNVKIAFGNMHKNER